MSDDIYDDAPEETEARPVCDDSGQGTRFERDGHFVCRECLEEELEHDPPFTERRRHTLGYGDAAVELQGLFQAGQEAGRQVRREDVGLHLGKPGILQFERVKKLLIGRAWSGLG
jgi:hypothetical protein